MSTLATVPPSTPRIADIDRFPLVRHDSAEAVVATELDGRGGTPPKRIPAIMAALQAIPAGAAQYLRTSDEPTELRRALAKRRVESESARLPDGTWRTRLRLLG